LGYAIIYEGRGLVTYIGYEGINTRALASEASPGILKQPLRIIDLGVSLANGKDIGEWIGATSQTIFNFAPNKHMQLLVIHLQSMGIPHHPTLR
jgi:hypothetical protein